MLKTNIANQPVKTALIDASSAIILCKAGLHRTVTEMYKVVMTAAVFNEITANNYPDGKEYQKLLNGKSISLAKALVNNTNEPTPTILSHLDKGEQETLLTYFSGLGHFIITDDGDAAKFCQREQIPFINALLIPVILKLAELKNEGYCREKLTTIIDIGWYSSKIITSAKEFQKEDLSLFLP